MRRRGAIAGVAAVASVGVAALAIAVARSRDHPPELRWCEATWSVTYQNSSTYADIAATSDHDVWAVGTHYSLHFFDRSTTPPGHEAVSVPYPLVEHWNGKRWTQPPNHVYDRGSLTHVAASRSGDAWAIGTFDQPPRQRPLIARWDGVSWGRVAAPRIGEWPTDVEMVGPHRVWVVSGGRIYESTGRGWRLQAGTPRGVQVLAARTGRDAWVFTWTRREGAALRHWDGRRWSRTGSPPKRGIVYDLAIAASGEAWAVGMVYTSYHETASLTMQWDGRSWRIVPSPSAGKQTSLSEVDVGPAGDVWAFGGNSNVYLLDWRQLVIRWNGHRWRVVPNPGASDHLTAVEAVDRDDVLVAGEDLYSYFGAAKGWAGHYPARRGTPRVVCEDPIDSRSQLPTLTVPG